MKTKPRKYATLEEARLARIARSKEWREKQKKEKMINNLLSVPFKKFNEYLGVSE